jgi:hypothetical protein
MELRNSDFSPHVWQVPMDVGPLGLSIIQKCSQSEPVVSSVVKSFPLF